MYARLRVSTVVSSFLGSIGSLLDFSVVKYSESRQVKFIIISQTKWCVLRETFLPDTTIVHVFSMLTIHFSLSMFSWLSVMNRTFSWNDVVKLKFALYASREVSLSVNGKM